MSSADSGVQRVGVDVLEAQQDRRAAAARVEPGEQPASSVPGCAGPEVVGAKRALTAADVAR